mgnify:CR=1 FL=1
MITLTFLNSSTIEVAPRTQPQDFLNKIAEAENVSIQDIAAVRINNEICPLTYSIDYSAKIQAVLASSTEGAAIYRRTLCFVLAASAHTLFPDKRLIVGHSLGHGYYYTLDGEKPITLFEINNEQSKIEKEKIT